MLGACSIDCAVEARRASQRKDPVCTDCGNVIVRPAFKCDNCKSEAKRQWKRAAKRRRAARKQGIPYEPYTLNEIAGRDQNRCGLCGKRVAMTKQVPHPKAPTIDHILPIAAGGDDTKANVQLAHFECNWRKADRGEQQLRMVG